MKFKTLSSFRDFHTDIDCITVKNDFYTLKVKPSTSIRYGIISAKRVFRLAVERTRARRLLRDWLAFHSDLLVENHDYIFLLKYEILQATRDQGRESIKNALISASKLISTNANK